MIADKNSSVQERLEVNGKRFIQNKWNPMKCFVNATKIGKLVGVPVLMMFGQNEEDVENKMAQAFYMLCDNLDEGEIERLITLVLDGTKTCKQDSWVVESNGVNIDEVFFGDLGGVIKLISQVIKNNYSSLFQKGTLEEITGAMGLVVGASNIQQR